MAADLIQAMQYDFNPYFQHYPFMSRYMDGGLDGNAILYAGHYGLLTAKLFGSYDKAKEHSAELYAKSHLKERPGVITRGPHKWNDPQTHDDYVGLATLSFLGGGAAAWFIYSHGKSNHWSFFRGGKIQDWFNAQFWRLPGLVQHLKLCASENLNLFDRLWWAIGVAADAYSKDASGKLLTWHYVSVYEMSGKKYFLCDWAVRKWKRSIIEAYPDSMGGIFRTYYEQTHPFVKWSQGVI